MSADKPKRRPGRPATGQKPQRSIRLPDELLAGIQEHRERLARMAPGLAPTDADALRDLLARGITSAREIDQTTRPDRKRK